MLVSLMRVIKVTGRIAPERIIIGGYVFYVIAGTLLLSMPFCRKLAEGPRLIDNLFIAVSAMSTTGLATVSVNSSYNFTGQLVILALIQLGGLGYMTIGSFLSLAVSGKMSPFQTDISLKVLSMPENFKIGKFIKSIIVFTVLIELLGAIALYPIFQSHGCQFPVWQAVFHSVSAFCTAGFSLIDTGFEGFRTDISLNIVIITLSYLGAIGFIVLHDCWNCIIEKKRKITLTSKIIVWSTIWISIIGTILFAINEPLVSGKPVAERIISSWFQVMTASTTVGFNTIPIGSLSLSSVFLLTIVMIIGASPSGTGGGLKTTTFSALWAVMLSAVRHSENVTFAGKSIPFPRLKAAVAGLVFYLLALTCGIYAISLVEQKNLTDLIFECASALGTVGLSRGITDSLSDIGKIIITILMFIGRAGPVAIGMAIFVHKTKSSSFSTEDIVV